MPARRAYRFQLCACSFKMNQTGQGCLYLSISSFFFSLLNLMAGGQLWTRRESLTHIHRLLTHLAHLYNRKLSKQTSALLVFGGDIDTELLSTLCPSYFCFSLVKLPLSTTSNKCSRPITQTALQLNLGLKVRVNRDHGGKLYKGFFIFFNFIHVF